VAELKTKLTKESVRDFLSQIDDKQRRQDCKVVADLMSQITGAKPEMWGPSIIGFGRTLYKYPNGREMEWMAAAFSPRKSDLTIYLMPGPDAFPDLMKKLGKHRTGKSCLYIKRLDDIDLKVLGQLIKESVAKTPEHRSDKKTVKSGSKK
jgi:Domain of unknown function (DU1801)